MSLFTKQNRSFDGGYFVSSSQLIPTRPPMATGGVPVTPATAITKIPLLAATNLVADMPQILDVGAWRGEGGTRREMALPAHIEDPEGLGYGLADFACKYLVNRILRGNVFIFVDAVGSDARPTQVTMLNPDEVSIRRDPKTGRWEFGYHREWYGHFGSGDFQNNRIIHRRAHPIAGQILGLSVIANHARTLGLSLAAEQFGADFFGDGAHPSGILTTDQPVSEDQAKTIKARFIAAIRGSREPAVLGAGVKYTQVQIAPHESQFIDTQQFTAAELCRMVGPGVAEMLGYETGGHLTYTNVQSRALHLLIFTVDKWLKEFEDCLSDIFVPGPQHIEYDRAGLLRMTATDRWNVYESQLGTGARVINEIRDDEGEKPVDWGDQPFLPAFGRTGTAAAEAEQIAALNAEGTPVAGSGKKTNTPGKGKVPAAPKIAGQTSK